jgi:hypothetical protein
MKSLKAGGAGARTSGGFLQFKIKAAHGVDEVYCGGPQKARNREDSTP